MKPSRPPVLATKLLLRFVSGPYRDALAGDLAEQFQQGRSGTWYWRQVLFGIVTGVAKDVRSYKLLAARSAVIGLAIYLLSSFPVNLLTFWLATHGWLPRPIALGLLVYLACGFAGWIGYRMNRTQPFTTVCIFSGTVLLFEAAHTSLGFLLSAGKIPPVSPVLLIGALLLRPLSIMIGGIAGSIRFNAPANTIQSLQE